MNNGIANCKLLIADWRKVFIKTFLAVQFAICTLHSAMPLEWGSFYGQADSKTKAIALTFDDGPNPSTLKVLELLKEENIKATFFMLGSQAEVHPTIAKAVAQAGHEIGNHTYRHVAYHGFQGNAPEKLRLEITRAESAIQVATGVRPQLLRMPHGFMRSWVKEVAKEKQLIIVHWTYGSDWQKIPSEKMARDYTAQVRSGSIFLFHDGAGSREATLASVRAVISEARKKGLAIVPAGTLLGLSN